MKNGFIISFYKLSTILWHFRLVFLVAFRRRTDLETGSFSRQASGAEGEEEEEESTRLEGEARLLRSAGSRRGRRRRSGLGGRKPK